MHKRVQVACCTSELVKSVVGVHGAGAVSDAQFAEERSGREDG